MPAKSQKLVLEDRPSQVNGKKRLRRDEIART